MITTTIITIIILARLDEGGEDWWVVLRELQVNPGVERKSESCRQSVDRTQSSLPTKSKVLRKNKNLYIMNHKWIWKMALGWFVIEFHRVLDETKCLDLTLWPKLVKVMVQWDARTKHSYAKRLKPTTDSMANLRLSYSDTKIVKSWGIK